jgi:hypothetical protein
MGIIHALLYAFIFGVLAAIFAALRLPKAKSRRSGYGGNDIKPAGAAGAAVVAFAVAFILVLLGDWAIHIRPVTTFPGLIWVITGDLIVVCFAVWIADVAAQSVSVGTILAPVGVIVLVIVWATGYNSGHDAHKAAYGIVHVTEYNSDTLPASTTSNLVIVTGDEAYTRASQAMSSGIASTRNYSSYLDLGPATLQMIDGHMWYVFSLEFQGNINKSRLGGKVPGWIQISAEDPNAEPVERYAPDYPNASMTVSLAGGQGSEPDRWAYDHGYSGYLLSNPTLEIPDQGYQGQSGNQITPYWSVTLLSPQLGWTFQAPAGMLLINAHTGQVTRYSLPGRGQPSPAPSWVDRIYSADQAAQITNWYGFYGHAPFGGQGNSNRYQVSGDPVMVYTGNGNPSWRMLLTSYGNEVSAYRIVEMDSATGAMSVYAPANPMGVESTVASAFCNASGVGAGNVRANHLIPQAMTLHVIDGQLVWMTSYEPSTTGAATDNLQEGNNADPCGSGTAQPENATASPSFTGVGFVPAYHVSGANAVFGSTRSQALANLLTQLASQAGNQGQANAGGVTVTVAGKVASIRTDVAGGNTVYYVVLEGTGGKPDYTRVYVGTSSLLGPGIVEASPGDAVTISVLKINAGPGAEQMQSFADATRPLTTAGA